MTELTDCSDDVLETALKMFYRHHAQAMDDGDVDARRETHWAIQQILAEQSRRLDAWIAEHVPTEVST